MTEGQNMFLLALIYASEATLAILSVLSVAVMIERSLTLRRLRRETAALLLSLREKLSGGHGAVLMSSLKDHVSPLAAIVEAGLRMAGNGAGYAREAMSAASQLQQERLRQHLSLLATAGSSAPYIGLFGTVLGVIKAFADIAIKGVGGAGVVGAGISHALISTAFGLFVAIPAVFAYNHFTGQVNRFALDLDFAAAELMPTIEASQSAGDTESRGC